MAIFMQLIADWWVENATTVKNEIEDRTGQRPNADNALGVRTRAFDEEGEDIHYAVLIFNGDVVGFITVDWGEPLLKICYV